MRSDCTARRKRRKASSLASPRRESALQSLKELGVEKVDLLLMHWPDAWTPESTNDSHQPDTTVSVLDTWCAPWASAVS